MTISSQQPAQSEQQPRRQLERRLCRLLETVVSDAFGVAVRDLRAAKRGPAPVAFARQAAMYLGHVVFGLNLTRVGRGFGRDRATARHACRLVEDRRDDPVFDAAVSRLERECKRCLDALLAKRMVRP